MQRTISFLNPTTRKKSKIIHYSPILQGCINTHSRRAKFKNFQIILDSGISSTIVMGNIMKKLKTEDIAEKMWENQVGKFTTSKKVNVYLCLLEFSATKIVTWKCHVDEYTNGRCSMIIGRYLLNSLGMDSNLSENIIIGSKGPYEGC